MILLFIIILSYKKLCLQTSNVWQQSNKRNNDTAVMKDNKYIKIAYPGQINNKMENVSIKRIIRPTN